MEDRTVVIDHTRFQSNNGLLNMVKIADELEE